MAIDCFHFDFDSIILSRNLTIYQFLGNDETLTKIEAERRSGLLFDAIAGCDARILEVLAVIRRAWQVLHGRSGYGR